MDSHTVPSVLREDAFAFDARQDAFASEGGGRNHGCQIAKEFLTKLKAVEKQHGGGNSKTIIFFKMRICLLKRMKKFSPTFTSFQDKTVAFNSGLITEICGKMYALTWQQWL